jgi:hypothetical protein
MNDSHNEVSDERTYTIQYDEWTDQSPSVAVVKAVAAVTGDDPTAIEPLTETINPDAMDRLIETEDSRGTLSITFGYSGCVVTAEANGDITVTLSDDPEPTR